MTSHAASDGSSPAEVGEAWRVLRFNEVTRQSVSRVRHPGGGQRPTEAIYSCLAFPYLRTMATAGAVSILTPDHTIPCASAGCVCSRLKT